MEQIENRRVGDYLSKLFGLNNKVALVTGGMGRLGTEFTEAFLMAGGRVAIFDVKKKPNEKLAFLAEKYPIFFLEVDIRKEEEVKIALEKVIKEWDVPTILLNNAGFRSSPGAFLKGGVPFEDYPMEVWEEVFTVNITAAAICSKLVGRKMIENKKKGVIINIASIYGVVAPDQRIYQYGENKFVKDPSYSASKAALIALTRDLAVQWARFGIRVVALSPGGVFNPESDPRFVQNYESKTPLNRMATIEDLKGAIIFLASDASSYMTGANLIIDGGWTAW